MNKKFKHGINNTELLAALDHSVEAAFALRMSEEELVTELIEHMHSKVVEADSHNPESPKKLFNPLAGP